MAKPLHHVVIGSGVTGSEAVGTLRKRDPKSRITMVTLNSLLFYRRYEIPNVFNGQHDWSEFLVHPHEFYTKNNITVRRNSRVTDVDSKNQMIQFDHNEKMHYDTLLVASGVRNYFPEELSDYRPLINKVSKFEDAMKVNKQLPKKGHALILGGDMIGLDLARNLVKFGYKVTLAYDTNQYMCWPHPLDSNGKKKFIKAVEKLGIKTIDASSGIEKITGKNNGTMSRKITFKNKEVLKGDVIIPAFGMVPSVEFMLNSGVGIERGVMVDTKLTTSVKNIWAAGDVCQIWDKKENDYRFYYGWKNVRAMGVLAAENMTGGNKSFTSVQNENLRLNKKGTIESPFWEYN